MADIPKPIALTWAAMCKWPGYFSRSVSDPPPGAFRRFAAPLLSLSLSDDRIMPTAAIEALNRSFVNAQIERVHLRPRDIGLTRVGHINALKKGHAVLWPALSRWLCGEDWRLAVRSG